jgi:hypothetical protein
VKSETTTEADVIRKWRNTSFVFLAILAVISISILAINMVVMDFVSKGETICRASAACSQSLLVQDPFTATDIWLAFVNFFATIGMVFSLILFFMVRIAKNGKAPNWWSSD